jgi:catechol 2,3-dioxygenase-like lactoylglutathione lyase family enzyme
VSVPSDGAPPAPPSASRGLHHVEVWVPDHARAERSWGWLLGRLGYERTSTWADGSRWDLDGTYLVLESGPDVRPVAHDRVRPGVNHLAFWAGTPGEVDALVRDASGTGGPRCSRTGTRTRAAPTTMPPTSRTATATRSSSSPNGPRSRRRPTAPHTRPGPPVRRLLL